MKAAVDNKSSGSAAFACRAGSTFGARFHTAARTRIAVDNRGNIDFSSGAFAGLKKRDSKGDLKVASSGRLREAGTASAHALE